MFLLLVHVLCFFHVSLVASNRVAVLPPAIVPAIVPSVSQESLSPQVSSTSTSPAVTSTGPSVPITPVVPASPAITSVPSVPMVPHAELDKASSPSQRCIVKPADGPAKYVMRFIIVGSMSVGKSCLLLQFTDHRFAANVGPTIGVDFGSASLNIDGENVKLQIWDTAGQEDFQAITRAYYREAAAAILVYDKTNLQSYEKLQSWLSAVQCNSTNPNIVITLVG